VKTVRNQSASPITLSWCIEPTHWEGGTHDASGSFQADAFDGAESASPDIFNEQIIGPGGELVFDETAANGSQIDADVSARSMV
jgi:hypothetical protein